MSNRLSMLVSFVVYGLVGAGVVVGVADIWGKARV
jgi:hypothetical protein